MRNTVAFWMACMLLQPLADGQSRWNENLALAEREYLLAAGEEGAFDRMIGAALRRPAIRSGFALDQTGRKTSTVSGKPRFQYDPTIATILAGLESRRYERRNEAWKTVPLQWPAEATEKPYYNRPVPIHYKRGDAGSRHVFVVLNSSYSTWRSGTWTNKTAAALEALYPGSHLIVVAGFLTPEILAAQPTVPELTGRLAAADLIVRTASFLQRQRLAGTLDKNVRAGVIGFSGGASLALMMLAEDSRRNGPDGATFGLGCVAFSPVLDAGLTFDVLDSSSEAALKAGFSKRAALTTFPSLLRLMLSGYTPSNLSKFAALLQPSKADQRLAITRRFYREFLVVDLKTVARAKYQLGRDLPHETHAAYYQSVFGLHRQEFKLPTQMSLAQYADLTPTLKLIAGTLPAYVVFATDDPVLSRSTLSRGHDDAVARLMQQVRGWQAETRIRWFTPPRGAHMGYLLDSHYFGAALRAFFGED